MKAVATSAALDIAPELEQMIYCRKIAAYKYVIYMRPYFPKIVFKN